MVEYERVIELDYIPTSGRSKYRNIILQALEHFKNNTDQALKITFPFASEADNASNKLRLWILEGEPVFISRKKNIVYIIRSDIIETGIGRKN